MMLVIIAYIQIYGMGPFITPGPGALLYEQDFDPDAASWNTITLRRDCYRLTDKELWVGYYVRQTRWCVYTCGCDAGPV